MKWAVDFAPPSSKLSKRRGKRAGKQKLKYTPKIREARKSEVLGELCDKVAALSLDTSGSTTPSKPRDSITNPLDTVRHHWAPQFPPEKSLEPSAPENAFFQHNRIFQARASPSPTHHEESKPEGPRFFPLSAFLASPPPAALQISASKPTRPVMTQNSPTIRSLAETPSTSAQEAVASAGRALATEETNTVEIEEPLFRFEDGPILESVPLIAQRTGSHRQTPECFNAKALPSSPLPITFPLVASPVLTPALVPSSLPTTSPYRPIDFRPNYVSEELPQTFPKRSWIRADIYRSSRPYSYGYGESHIPSLGTAVSPSPRPSVAPQPRRTMVSPPLGPSRFDEHFRSVYPWYTTPVQLGGGEEFLKMGHGNPCWCSHCPNSVPLGEVPGEEVWASELRKSLRNGSTPLSARLPGEKLQPPIGTRPRKTSPETVPTPESSSVFNSGPRFEELTRTMREAFMPGSDNSGSQDNVWTMVSADDDASTRSQFSAPRSFLDDYSSAWEPSPPPPTRATVSEEEHFSEPEILSFPTPSSEFSELAWTVTPSGSGASSPLEEHHFVHYTPTHVESTRYVYPSETVSPALSPTLWPALPSAPPPTSAHSPRQTQRSASASGSEVISNVESI